jgi:hypothetical protein
VEGLLVGTRTIEPLGQAFANLEISEDPYFISLMKEDSEKSKRKLKKIWLNHKAWRHDQMESFYTTALKIYKELGVWATDYYISKSLLMSTKWLSILITT